MPELPDIEAYLHAMQPRIVDRPLERIRIASPFLVRSVEPPVDTTEGRVVRQVRRIGKRIVLCMDGDLHLVFHLMIAGRFRWLASGAKLPARIGLGAFDFPTGILALTEAGTKKRASLHLVQGEAELAAHDPGGCEPLDISLEAFEKIVRRENHTIKRTLTDPRLFSGIGNAYSDEILHAARLSPIKLTAKLTSDEIVRLHEAVQKTLRQWTATLCEQFADRFPGPGDITAFREGFAVHGRFNRPCPVCESPVQRIRYAENETNYCARCQNHGRVLADRSLSRLLKNDWPRKIEEFENT